MFLCSALPVAVLLELSLLLGASLLSFLICWGTASAFASLDARSIPAAVKASSSTAWVELPNNMQREQVEFDVLCVTNSAHRKLKLNFLCGWG